MFKQFDYKILVGIVISGVLLVAGTYYFSQRSYKRFEAEIGVSPESTMSSKPISENDTSNTPDKSKEKQSLKSDNENVKVESKPVVDSESTHTTKDKEATAEKIETSEFDASSLISTFGLPEEVKLLFDEDVEEADFEKAQAYLAEKYGQSPEVDAIMDRLKQMSGGPVELDDLTALFEEWIEILPEEQQENRRQLKCVLPLLNQKAQEGIVPVNVVVGSDLDLDPSLLEGENVQTFRIETTETEIIEIDD